MGQKILDDDRSEELLCRKCMYLKSWKCLINVWTFYDKEKHECTKFKVKK